MTKPNKVLITGSAGRLGQAAVSALSEADLRCFDRIPTPGLSDMVVGDISQLDAVMNSMEGIDTVIHLAATPDDDDDFMNTLLPNNIVGVYNLFEAAKQQGARRLIVASSGQVVWHQRIRGPWPVKVDTMPTPRYWYAATKMFLEAAGRAFHEAHGMSVLVVRLGWCPRTPKQVRQIGETEWAQDVYLSPEDAGRFFASAVNPARDFGYAVVYATSKPVRRRLYDLEPAKELLGYEPSQQWPQGVEITTD